MKTSNEQLFLGVFEGWSDAQLRDHLIREYHDEENASFPSRSTRGVIADFLNNVRILIAYESEEEYGRDDSWLIFESHNGQLYENYANHCSYEGFEGQFDPEPIDHAYLLHKINNEHFLLDTTEYGQSNAAGQRVRDFLNANEG